MKKLAGLRIVVMILVMILLLVATGSYAQNPKTSSGSKSKLEVIYFHATMRCPTCNAIEDNARKLLEKSFRSQLDNGEIKFASYNVDEDANKAIVEKYQISFSTLLLIKSDGTKTDLTSKAFQYALVNPPRYDALLKAEIEKNLK